MSETPPSLERALGQLEGRVDALITAVQANTKTASQTDTRLARVERSVAELGADVALSKGRKAAWLSGAVAGGGVTGAGVLELVRRIWPG